MVVVKCKQCGKENTDNLKNCFYCGTSLIDDFVKDEKPSNLVPSNNRHRKLIFIVVAVVLFLGTLSGAFVFFANYSIISQSDAEGQIKSVSENIEDSKAENHSDNFIRELNYDAIDETVVISNEVEFAKLKDNLDEIDNTQVIAANCFFTKKDNNYCITYDKKSYISVVFSEKTRIANITDKNVDLVFYVTRVNEKTEVVLVYENGYDAFLSNYNETIEYYSQDVVGKTAKIINTTVNYIPDNNSYWIYLPNGEVGFGIVSTEMDLSEFAGKTIDCKFVNVDSLPEGLTNIEYDTFWNVYSIDKVY